MSQPLALQRSGKQIARDSIRVLERVTRIVAPYGSDYVQHHLPPAGGCPPNGGTRKKFSLVFMIGKQLANNW